MKKIYLDYAATTPADPAVIKAMEPYFFEKFGNASSPHSLGQEAHQALENARETLAKFLGAQPNEIIFNSRLHRIEKIPSLWNQKSVWGTIKAFPRKSFRWLRQVILLS